MNFSTNNRYTLCTWEESDAESLAIQLNCPAIASQLPAYCTAIGGQMHCNCREVKKNLSRIRVGDGGGYIPPFKEFIYN